MTLGNEIYLGAGAVLHAYGIVAGMQNPRVSAQVSLGLGYGLAFLSPTQTRTPLPGEAG